MNARPSWLGPLAWLSRSGETVRKRAAWTDVRSAHDAWLIFACLCRSGRGGSQTTFIDGGPRGTSASSPVVGVPLTFFDGHNQPVWRVSTSFGSSEFSPMKCRLAHGVGRFISVTSLLHGAGRTTPNRARAAATNYAASSSRTARRSRDACQKESKPPCRELTDALRASGRKCG